MASLGVLMIVLMVLPLGRTATTSPIFSTTIAATFQTGSKVLITSSPTLENGLSTTTTPLLYKNTYSSTPQFGYGLAFLSSQWSTTIISIQTTIDLSIASSSVSSQTLKLQFTPSTLTQLSLNYVACQTGYFLDVRPFLQDLTTFSTISTSGLNSERSVSLTVPYKYKSNSSNAVVTYSTVGLSMMRTANTFEYALTTGAFSNNDFSLSLTLKSNNGMKFIRLVIFDYQNAPDLIATPMYMNIGFLSGFTGTIPDSSGMGLSTTGTILMGMAYWALLDSQASIQYNISSSGLNYLVASAGVTGVSSALLWYRQIVCALYYYLSGPTCYSCDYSCTTCSSSSNASCLSCEASSFRTFDPTYSTCPCNTNYLDVGVHICQKITCPTYCTSCSSNNYCVGCVALSYRTLANGSCLCSTYAIDMSALGLVQCMSCYPTCLTCQNFNTETACLSCNLVKDHRSFLSSNKTCNCVNGYYEVPNLATLWVSYLFVGAPCLKCQYTCQTCTVSTGCSTCNSTLYRQYNSTSGYCSCMNSYYDDQLSQLCLSCPYYCLTCSDASTCLGCPSTRTLVGGGCPCQVGFYDAGVAACQPCHYSCYSCANSTACSTCNTTYFRTMVSNLTCGCLTGHYDIYGVTTCAPCHVTCQSCAGSASNACLSCDTTTREITSNETCVCKAGYYELSPVVAACGSCYYTCQSCLGASTQCASCNASNHRFLNGTSCLCENRYYDDGGNQPCVGCQYFCLTCSNSSTCSSCDAATRNTTDLATCPCLVGYYEVGALSCQPCLSTCLACTNGLNCSSCPANRTLTVLQTCVCGVRTYQPDCLSCHYSCQSCTLNSTNCQSCNGSSWRYLQSTRCVCFSSYYDDGSSQLCQPCHYSCATCSDGMSCSSCPGNRVSNGTLCACLSSFYQDSVNLNCLACHYSCQTCSSYSVCTTCNATIGRITSNATTLCICSTGNYDNGANQICFPCLYSCSSCNAYSLCSACRATDHRSLLNTSCPCLTGYHDSGAALCQQCQYSCASCSSSTGCSTCAASNFRVYASGPYCDCASGYYDPGVVLCVACSYTCSTCESTSAHCLTCPSTRTFDNSSYSCPCNPGKYDSGAATCSLCLYSCATCGNSSECLTCPSSRMLDTSYQCVCKSGHYEVQNQTECQPCSPYCSECSAYEVCTDCDSTSGRMLDNSSCVCTVGYYDPAPANYTCTLCHYTCSSCSSASQCSTCNVNYYRTYNNTTLLCSCLGAYYDDGSNQPCTPCPYDCLTCLNSSYCLSCSPTRVLSNVSRCQCIDSYYSNGTLCEQCPVECSTCTSSSVCTACLGGRLLVSGGCVCSSGLYAVAGSASCAGCHYSCSTCVSPSQCSSCNSTLLRYLTATYCLCQKGSYDDTTNQKCLSCHYSCASCNSSSACLTCSSLLYRIYNSSSSLCVCAPGYYENSLTKTCVQCSYSCLTCISSSQCSSCNTNFNRQLNLSTLTCDCPAEYYYDTYVSQVCAACEYTCLSCVTTATTCTACLAGNHRTISGSSCPCNTGYFNIVNQPVCLTCNYQCQTCAASASSCTLCNTTDHRAGTPSCPCIEGFYDAGAALCSSCHYSCETCETGLTCSSCNLTVSFRVLNPITGICDCTDRYYDLGTAICQSCDYTCLTCNHPTECLSCPSTRALSSKACLCQPKYYDDGSSLLCLGCDYSCQTCANSSSCSSCNSGQHRVFNSSTALCSCIDLYYDTGVELCVRCDLSCSTCTVANVCSSCPPDINKTVNITTGSSLCQCLYGYYENATAGMLLGYNSVCLPCDYACQTCSLLPNNCTLCNSTANRHLSGTYCQCLSGYFGVPGQQLCLGCYTHCLTCYGTLQSNCLSCDNLTYFLNNTCYTLCPDYYQEAISPIRICASCPSHCLSCPSSLLVCSQCVSPYFIFAYNSSYSVCITQCPSLYYQVNQTCLPCQHPCVQCSALMVCTSCPSGYYLSSGYCYPCEGTCLSCTGATALDCLTCQPDYLLKDGVCQKLTCSATQYVQSTYGCQDCASTFAKSLACISTGPTSCQSGYLLSNAQCLTCSQITGYTYDSASGKCKDKCGDGLLITDQCDDGNTLNGDGCSSTCQVESGWKCPNNVCQLVSAPEIWLITMSSFPRNHSLVLVVGLSVGVRLVEGNFILTFTSITQYSYQVTTLNAYWNRYMLVIEYFQSPQNEQLSISVKAPLESRVRLLQVPLGPLEPLPMDQEWTNRTEDVSSQRLLVSLSLNISLSLSVTVPVETSPPAIYITQTQSELYSKYLMLLVAVLQLSVLAVIIVTLLMRLKVMLLVIDALNSLSVLFILSGPAVYNVTLASYQASVGLRRFFYPFGELLPDIGSSFYYFDYRSNFFSSSALQAATIVLCLLGTLFYQSCGKETDNPWYYYRTGFVFAFAYDLLLTSMAVFFCAPYNSYQSSYSWMFAVLSSIWLASEAVHYYRSQDDLNTGRKVVPAVSFITNELDNKEKSKVEQNIFQFQQESGKERKIRQEEEEEKTQGGKAEIALDLSIREENVKYYDLAPSDETQYSLRHSNHITPSHLPLSCLFFGLLFSLLPNIPSATTRAGLLLGTSIAYFIFLLVTKNETLKAVRMVKLFLLSLIYIAMTVVGLVAAQSTSETIKNVDGVMVVLVCAGLTANLIGFILNVFKSEAYREYLVSKKNQEIMDRNRKQNEARQKIYNKPQVIPSRIRQPSSSLAEPVSHLQIFEPEIQLSEEQAEEKEIKISQLKQSRKLASSRTDGERDVSSLIHMQIDDEISEVKEEHQRDLNEEKQLAQRRSPHRNQRGSRIQAMNNSQMSIQSPSPLIDHTLGRIEEMRAPSRVMAAEEPPLKKKTKKKVKGAKEEKPAMVSPPMERDSSVNLQDILSEMDMPRGFKLQEKTEGEGLGRRLMEIDEISSIREERQQFMQQAISDQSGGMSVFNKILQDYQVYRNRKVDRKKRQNKK